ncbi:MAG: hypothetical protein COU40_00835, partial [Candidatus Moranbacteria bacterium CG10_big_fil_rev_8_21_14_0_10_35_21]
CPYCFEISFWAIKDKVNCEARESALGQKYAQHFVRPLADERKKIGSENFVFSVFSHRNFRIADRTLILDFKNAFKIAEKYHADPANAGEDSIDFTKSENWRCFFESFFYLVFSNLLL